MKVRRYLLTAAVLLILAAPSALAVGRAAAEPGPIELVSSNGSEQADYAASPALSGDGRYVVFGGQIGGFAGIFRKDLSTGEFAPVVVTPVSGGKGSNEVAFAPSISADGRYVSFTTREPLDPANDLQPGSEDVYVADMATSPPTYELASAVDGSHQGLTYKGPGGAVAAGRVALSADGREVVFVTTAESDLAPATAPAGQVVVRNLQTLATTVITVERDAVAGEEKPVQGGGILTSRGEVNAALSADGSTVAWIGVHIAQQVAIPADEAGAFAKDGAEYNEPLWRRVPDDADPAPVTRRMVNATMFPDLVSGANGDAFGTCGGGESGWDVLARGAAATPSLSADGDEIALIGEPNAYAEAYVIDMAGAPTVRQLTKAIPVPRGNVCDADPEFPTTAGSLGEVAISAAGDRVAFTTDRQQFPLSPPSLVGSPPVGFGVPEVYLADLAEGTLQRLTHGNGGISEPSQSTTNIRSAGAASVSFDASGEKLSFASSAYNLVPDDANGTVESSASDVFVVTDPRPVKRPGSGSISAPPSPLRSAARWRLAARASSLPDGRVRVAVSVPGRGRLRATARSRKGTVRPIGRVASARRRAGFATVLSLVMRPAGRFRAAVRRPGGVEAELRVAFHGPDGKPLRTTLSVRFRAHREKGVRR